MVFSLARGGAGVGVGGGDGTQAPPLPSIHWPRLVTWSCPTAREAGKGSVPLEEEKQTLISGDRI